MLCIDSAVVPRYTVRMKNSRNNELAVCGFEAARALTDIHPEQVQRLYFTRERAPAFGAVCRLLAAQKRPYNAVEADELERLCGSVHHQGVVAMIKTPRLVALTSDITDDWLHHRESALLLDRVGNANNLGAIVRSAAFFGFRNIIIPLDEAQSSVTTSAYRVAQGGMEFVQLYTVRSVTKLLLALKGKMIRLGTAVDAPAPVSDIPRLCAGKGALIVLGNEEHGISREVKQHCDAVVTIPAFGDKRNARAATTATAGCTPSRPLRQRPLESLNVAQAAAIILYEYSKCQRP